MSNFRKFISTIKFKLLLPIIIIFIIVMSIAFTRKILDYKEFANKNAISEAMHLASKIDNRINDGAYSSLFTASMYSDFDAIKWAYSLYNKTGNMDSSVAIIKRNINSSISTVEKRTGIRPKIHFHLPPAKSFCRSWSDKKGDDLSSFRKTILDISENHKAIKGIEVGKGGFVIRGISPIYNSKNEYLGSVESIFPFNVVLSDIVNTKKQSYALYIKKNQLKVAEELNNTISNYNKNNIKTGDYALIESSDNFLHDDLQKEDFIFENAKTKYKVTDNSVCAIDPIKDYSGKIVGVVITQIDITEVTAIVKKQIILNIFISFIVIIVIIFIVNMFLSKIVVNPINKLSSDLSEIAKGKIVGQIDNHNTGVMSTIYNAFNVMLKRLEKTTEFANQIGEGNINANIDNVSEEDVLGQSLLRMKNNLHEAKVAEEKYKIEEDKRNWATKGFAEFGEILRQDYDDMKVFSTNIISNLVKYTKSNQGGLFIINDNDKNNIVLELMAAYAYDRNKYVDKIIKLGEGLVGTCAKEKETIFMKEVPDNYLLITSGLGESNPRNILMVPLKLENKVFGVIELASFTIYEDYQIKFIEKLCESIASSLSVAKTNIITVELLEQSQQQAEELAAQEEEMRQNLEEMTATQEQLEINSLEIKKQNNEMQAQMNAINKVALVSKTDPKGIITYVNDLFCEIAGYEREELIGKNHNIIRHPDMTKAAFKNLWDTIQAGNVWSGKVKNKTKSGGFYWVDANVSPILDEVGEIIEYVAIRFLITHYVDDKELVELVHKLLPDNDKLSKKNITNKKKEEIVEEQKQNNITKDNKNGLISELKEDHKFIAETLEKIQEIGVLTEEGMLLLMKSKEALLAHLNKEDEQLYPVLFEKVKTDPKLKRTLDVFGKEMEKITEFVLGFYEKYTYVENIDKAEFIKDISTFIVAFKNRIIKEELVIYKAYSEITQ